MSDGKVKGSVEDEQECVQPQQKYWVDWEKETFYIRCLATGPLYAAFPIASVMAQKGARYGNILVFLGAWSTLKIPMFLFEMSSLGIKFALACWLINIPGIILMAFIIERILSEKDKAPIYDKSVANNIIRTALYGHWITPLAQRQSPQTGSVAETIF